MIRMERSLLFNINWNEHVRLFTVVSPKNSDLSLITVQGVSITREERLAFRTENNELIIFCISGKSVLITDSEKYNLERECMAYIGRDCKCELVGLTNFLGIIVGAPAPRKHPIKIIYKKDIEGKRHHQFVGKEPYLYEVLTFIGPDFEAARLMAGITVVKSGNWSNWPPHNHGEKLEEIFFYYYLPYPGFGFQMIYENIENPNIFMIKENDIVIVPHGFHPNVVIPNYEMRYLWVLAAKKPYEDRTYKNWFIDPLYEKIVKVRI